MKDDIRFEASKSEKAISSYYDNTLDKRIKDYVYMNARVCSSIMFAQSWIEKSTSRILDIGCGIGVSANAFAESHTGLHVHAVDISSLSIDTAKQLFQSPRITFEVANMKCKPGLEAYDLITMIDVYEHIPCSEREAFQSALSSSMSEDGLLVLTCPSPLHQRHLALHNPNGLQIIDEMLNLEDFQQLAAKVQGEIVYFKYESIWNTNDYMYVVIARNVRYSPVSLVSHGKKGQAYMNRPKTLVCKFQEAMEIKRRRKRVIEKLGVRV